jgi:hypothetical protein
MYLNWWTRNGDGFISTNINKYITNKIQYITHEKNTIILYNTMKEIKKNKIESKIFIFCYRFIFLIVCCSRFRCNDSCSVIGNELI